MIRLSRGFTVIELSVAIVVLGIIAVIGTVAWNGVSTSYRDKARETETRTWITSFDNYKNRFYAYPSVPTGDGAINAVTICLGQFTSYNSKCGQYGSTTMTAYINASGSATMLSEISKIGTPLDNTTQPISDALVGPIAYSSQNTVGSNVTVTTQFINFFEGACPAGFTNINSSLPTSIALVLVGLPSGASANACAITKIYTYSTA